ncbi:MAG: hypothetical protein ABIY62_08695 [Ginsengibacter sp.]
MSDLLYVQSEQTWITKPPELESFDQLICKFDNMSITGMIMGRDRVVTWWILVSFFHNFSASELLEKLNNFFFH